MTTLTYIEPHCESAQVKVTHDLKTGDVLLVEFGGYLRPVFLCRRDRHNMLTVKATIGWVDTRTMAGDLEDAAVAIWAAWVAERKELGWANTWS